MSTMNPSGAEPADDPLRPLAVGPERAADLLRVSRDFFDKHLLAGIPHVVRGRRWLIPLQELDAWLERTSRLRP